MEEPVPKDTPSEGNRAPLIKTEPGTADDQSEVIKSVTAIAAINQTEAPPNTAVVGATPSVCAEAENKAETMNSVSVCKYIFSPLYCTCTNILHTEGRYCTKCIHNLFGCSITTGTILCLLMT